MKYYTSSVKIGMVPINTGNAEWQKVTIQTLIFEGVQVVGAVAICDGVLLELDQDDFRYLKESYLTYGGNNKRRKEASKIACGNYDNQARSY